VRNKDLFTVNNVEGPKIAARGGQAIRQASGVFGKNGDNRENTDLNHSFNGYY
jgi:hypothetical protein